MTTTTPDIGLPLLETQQQQPNVTHNEMVLLVSLMMNGVISVGLNTPPGSPVVGDSYVVGSSPTGAWSARANAIAIYTDGGWRFVPDRDNAGTPIAMGARQHGLNVFNRFDDALYYWSGAAWIAL